MEVPPDGWIGKIGLPVLRRENKVHKNARERLRHIKQRHLQM